MRGASTRVAVATTAVVGVACGGAACPMAPGEVPADDPIFDVLATRQRP